MQTTPKVKEKAKIAVREAKGLVTVEIDGLERDNLPIWDRGASRAKAEDTLQASALPNRKVTSRIPVIAEVITNREEDNRKRR